MAQYIIWNDNGIPGQYGYSEESGDLAEILQQYETAGIVIYSVDIISD